MPAIASADAFSAAAIISAASAAIETARLEPICVLADPWHDETRAIDTFDNRGDMQRGDRDPDEHAEEADNAPDAERRHADDRCHHREGEQKEQLGRHEDEAVLRVPLYFRVFLVDEQWHDG